MITDMATTKKMRGYQKKCLKSCLVYLLLHKMDLSSSFSYLTANASSLSNTGLYSGFTCREVNLKVLSVNSFYFTMSSLCF